MDDIKTWLRSRTVWAAIVGFGAMVAQFFGVDLGSGETAIVDAVLQIVEAVSFLAAIVFRVVATTKLTS